MGAIGLAVFLVPFLGLLWRVPWSDLGDLYVGDVVTDALRLSLITSLAATGIAALIGIPLAWLLARTDFPGRPLARGLVTLPLVLPPVVGGAALLFALGRRGLIGAPLAQATGLVLPFSTWGVVIANTFVAMPFLVITVEAALRNLDQRFEGAAATLGAGRWTVLRRVTLPMITPSLIAGLVLTWARALGEFGATITFAGNLQGRTQTLPLAVFVALESDRDVAVALSLLMVVVSLIVLIALRERWWRAHLTAPGLEARFTLRRGESFGLDIALSLLPGQTAALLGPNGAGKSTVVAALAGLLPIDTGTITLVDGHTRRPRTRHLRPRRSPKRWGGVSGLPVVPPPHRDRERGVRAAQPWRQARGRSGAVRRMVATASA